VANSINQNNLDNDAAYSLLLGVMEVNSSLYIDIEEQQKRKISFSETWKYIQSAMAPAFSIDKIDAEIKKLHQKKPTHLGLRLTELKALYIQRFRPITDENKRQLLFEEFAINGIFNTIKEYYPEYLTSVQTAFRQVDELKDLTNTVGASQGTGDLIKGIVSGTDRVNSLITICVNQDRLFGLAAKNSPYVYALNATEKTEPTSAPANNGSNQKKKTGPNNHSGNQNHPILTSQDLATIAQINESKVEAKLDPLNKSVSKLGDTMSQLIANISVMNAKPAGNLQQVHQLQAQPAPQQIYVPQPQPQIQQVQQPVQQVQYVAQPQQPQPQYQEYQYPNRGAGSGRGRGFGGRSYGGRSRGGYGNRGRPYYPNYQNRGEREPRNPNFEPIRNKYCELCNYANHDTENCRIYTQSEKGNTKCPFCTGMHVGECKRPFPNRFTKRSMPTEAAQAQQPQQPKQQYVAQPQQPQVAQPQAQAPRASLGNHGAQEVPRESHLNAYTVYYTPSQENQAQA
jgi:hypothetical protein